MGLEATPDEWVQGMVGVFREVRRVLRPDGTLWLNIGDSYAGSGKGPSNSVQPLASQIGPSARNAGQFANGQAPTSWIPIPTGCKPKDLIGIPWMLAFALRADGWYLRMDGIWNKPNPMPESIQGSRWERHRVTLDEYERLSGVRYTVERFNADGTSNLPDVSEREIPNSQGALYAEREGQSDRESTRRDARNARETTPVLSIGTRQEEPSEIHTDAQRQGDSAQESGEPERAGESSRRRANGSRLVSDLGSAQVPLSLLWETGDAVDTGSRDSIEQGRTELSREHRASMQVLQLQEEGQIDSDLLTLVPCPGCPKCEKNDGYILRMSAGRPTKAHEYLFLLSKSRTYFYDSDAIREEVTSVHSLARNGSTPRNFGTRGDFNGDRTDRGRYADISTEAGRNKRSVWTVATEAFPESHFATYPTALIEPCIKAGTSERGCCPECGAPWVREREPTEAYKDRLAHANDRGDWYDRATTFEKRPDGTKQGKQEGGITAEYITTGWRASCGHAGEPQPCTVLDPFAGAFTTALVAERLGRDSVMVEINPSYVEMGRKRVVGDAPMFTTVEVA